MHLKPKQTFFVIDDDHDMVQLLTMLLEFAGYEVLSETHSSLAFERVLELKPDCVLLDIMMPGVDGYALCEQIRAEESLAHCDVIMVSQKCTPADVEKAYGLGALGFIPKPLKQQSFLQHIDRILQHKIELKFWGVRGTLPVAGPHSLRYGGNTSCISIELPQNNFLILDAGTGIRQFSNFLNKDGAPLIKINILLSHPHWDHIHGLPFFTPLYDPTREIDIYGPKQPTHTVEQWLGMQMNGIHFPVTQQQLAANIEYHDVTAGDMMIGDVAVHSMQLSHSGICLGYCILFGGHKICYVTDNELFPKDSPRFDPVYYAKLKKFIAKADYVISDSTWLLNEYSNYETWGHSTAVSIAELAHEAEVKNLFLHHHDIDQTDDDIDKKVAEVHARLQELKSATQARAPAEGESILI